MPKPNKPEKPQRPAARPAPAVLSLDPVTEVTSHTLLIEWYDATADYADNNASNNRNNYNTAIAAVNALFTDTFTDEALTLFEDAGITNNDNFAVVMNTIRGNNPNTIGRVEQQELLIATYTEDPAAAVVENPDNAAAYDDGGRYLKDTNPNANENAFLAHWSKAFGVKKAEATNVLSGTIQQLEDIGALNSDYTDFAGLAPLSVQIPLIDAATELDTGEVFPAVGDEPT